MKSVTVITYQYPSAVAPTLAPFVLELVSQWKRMGIDVCVINPLRFTQYLKYCIKHTKKEDVQNGVYHPLYLTYPIFKYLPKLKKKLSVKSFIRACEKAMPKGDQVIYSHFLDAGYVASKIGSKYGHKSYCAFGESGFWTVKQKSEKDLLETFGKLTGFVAVSTENANRLIARGYATADKIFVVPNGVDKNIFKKLDKDICRRELGIEIEDDEILGVFVGRFCPRKGALRVCKASEGIDNLKLCFVGSGEEIPYGNNIIFKGVLSHERIPLMLGAADFFVLPTRSEGCCNALVEAMSCGLPIISSYGAFNDDILDENISLRVNPDSIEEIHEALEKFCCDKKFLEKMSINALKKSENFDIELRAKRIAEYIGLY